jgi:hypothetical protein
MGTDPDMKKGFLAEALDLIGSGGLLPIRATLYSLRLR